MNTPPDKTIIEEVALIKGISESFVEKDWYVTQAIKKVAEITYQDFQIVFTGGTALSKAHKLLQRFSEDSDFRVIAPVLSGQSKNQQRKILSGFKEAIITSLKTEFQVDTNKVFARNGNQFVALEIDYPTLFSRPDALRPHIQIEFTVTGLELPAILLPVSSFINELSRKSPEVTRIACTNPVENAADKLSAIAWRIPDRVRGQEDDDPSIVRHLHDLAILSDHVITHPAFKDLVKKTVSDDDKRSSSITGQTIQGKLTLMLNILRSDAEYVKEYERFVMGMSYAVDNSQPSFNQAIEKLHRLITYALN